MKTNTEATLIFNNNILGSHPMNKVLTDIYNELKYRHKVRSKADFAEQMDYNRSYISEVFNSNDGIPDKLAKKLIEVFGVNPTFVESGKGDIFADLPKSKPTGEEIRRRKAMGERSEDDDGLVAVPVGAQAGGCHYYDDPIFFNQLEVYKLPGLPYRGKRYRMFQVDGDSMEYINQTTGKPDGLIDGMWIVSEKVEPEEMADQQTGDISRRFTINNYYIHVIVEQRRIRIKRLYQYDKNYSGFVVISDNPDWDQEWLPMEDVKELWLFKRKLDWEVPPPKRIEIKIKPPNTENN